MKMYVVKKTVCDCGHSIKDHTCGGCKKCTCDYFTIDCKSPNSAASRWYAGADYNDERWHYVDLDRKTAIAEVAYQVAEAHKEKAND